MRNFQKELLELQSKVSTQNFPQGIETEAKPQMRAIPPYTSNSQADDSVLKQDYKKDNTIIPRTLELIRNGTDANMSQKADQLLKRFNGLSTKARMGQGSQADLEKELMQLEYEFIALRNDYKNNSHLNSQQMS